LAFAGAQAVAGIPPSQDPAAPARTGGTMSPRLRLFIPLLLTLGLGTLLWLGLANNPYRQDEATLGRTLPQWQSENLLDGGLVHTDQLKGEPFVLNVWASWCPNCRAEHPLLAELASTVPLYGLNYR